jgi:hypothetical protein
MDRLGPRIRKFRQVGPVAGTRGALGLVGRATRASARRGRLRIRPIRPNTGDLAKALGGLSPAEALGGPARAALPAVAAWQPDATVAERADAILAHRFDLLGSGPVELGPEIPWLEDFKQGREWPLDHISRIRIVYGDGSDIKVPWELSRAQHLPLLAATGEQRHLDEIGAQLRSWIAANPVEYGPNWACTMDVAIRAANWVAALVVCAESAATAPWLEEALASLLLHGRFIRSHLEWSEVRGNHYLANVVGLMPVAALFSRSDEGAAWLDWSIGELRDEMLHQVRPDGVCHEASIPYHRLVAEMFQAGAAVAEALRPGSLGDGFHERLAQMLQFTADYTRPDGLAPLMGDDDSGRFMPLGTYGSDTRDHRHLGPPAPQGSVSYRAGGFHVIRDGELYVLVRCGDVGFGGRGVHAHCDQLSFELFAGGRPLVVDPGSYLYTADAAARNAFRGTRFHATVTIDGADQSPLDGLDLFELPDLMRAELLAYDGRRFTGHHHGYERLEGGPVHERGIAIDGDKGTVRIRDSVRSSGRHQLEWNLPLAPGAAWDGSVARWPDGAWLEVESGGLEFAAQPGWYAPRYGIRESTTFLRARRDSGPGDDTQQIVLVAGNG